MLKPLLILALTMCPLALRAEGSMGVHRGYLFDVAEERTRRDIEMVMLEKPKAPETPPTVIVNDKLAKEFQEQYRYRFGQTTTEQSINNPSRTDGYSFHTGETLTIKRYQEEQRNYAMYMGRKLTEFHVDNYVKNDPGLKPVYELKDKISNVDVKVQSYKLKWKYNFAGPNMDVTVENPYKVDLRVRAEMTGVISAPTEMVYSAGYPVTNRVHVKLLHNTWDGVTQLITARAMTRSIWCSLTASQDTKPQGRNVQQDLLLLGFSWSD